MFNTPAEFGDPSLVDFPEDKAYLFACEGCSGEGQVSVAARGRSGSTKRKCRWCDGSGVNKEVLRKTQCEFWNVFRSEADMEEELPSLSILEIKAYTYIFVTRGMPAKDIADRVGFVSSTVNLWNRDGKQAVHREFWRAHSRERLAWAEASMLTWIFPRERYDRAKVRFLRGLWVYGAEARIRRAAAVARACSEETDMALRVMIDTAVREAIKAGETVQIPLKSLAEAMHYTP